MKPVKGDPLTGSLPRTQMLVPQDPNGQMRQRRMTVDPNEWPHNADPVGMLMSKLVPGRVVAVRTRFRGVRTWQVRTVSRSYEGRNKGRHYLVGMTRQGTCRVAWVDKVISVETVQRALAAGRAIRSLGR